MSLRPAKRLIRSTLTLNRFDVLLQGQCGFGNGFDLNPFLLLEDPRDDVTFGVMRRTPEENDSCSIPELNGAPN
jgi:hypothetical protein